MGTDLNYVRGSIWWTNLFRPQGTSIQGGFRPVIIVSSAAGCLSSDVVTVCPCTTKLKDLSVNVPIKPLVKGVEQRVLTNQLVTVPKANLVNYSGLIDPEDMVKVETGILVSLGIAKPVVDKLKASQEALALARKDKEALEVLVPQAKELVIKLNEIISRQKPIVNRVERGRKYIRRTPEEIESFISEWEDRYNNRNEVAEAFGFSTYGAAYNFYVNHRKKVK